MNSATEQKKFEKRYIQSQSLDKWIVLLVDDQLDNLMVAEVVLKFHGAEVVRASNGIEALRALETCQPSLILLDLSMPDMDGWATLSAIKSRPSVQHIPVIALTAHAMTGDKERVMQAGFTGYIAKPFSVSTFVAEILNILQGVSA